MRLQLFMARCGFASRRASEKVILEGRVSVNGKQVSELGTKVTAGDEVTVDGKKLTLEAEKRYVLLNKPKGYVCSMKDEKDRMTAASLLKDRYPERLTM